MIMKKLPKIPALRPNVLILSRRLHPSAVARDQAPVSRERLLTIPEALAMRHDLLEIINQQGQRFDRLSVDYKQSVEDYKQSMEDYKQSMEELREMTRSNDKIIQQNTDLRMEMARRKSELHLRAVLELICDGFQNHIDALPRKKKIPIKGKGKQGMINAIVDGRFDQTAGPDPLLFTDMLSLVIQSLYDNGIGLPERVTQASSGIYAHLSSIVHQGVSGMVEIDHRKHNTEQIAAILAIILFAKRFPITGVDIAFTNGQDLKTTLSSL
ncbi:hypothetical protein FB45DRAFT_905437 [Roridomyces roridus]|uniref:Uncharacterized protein n=1 Tax=Roridomyces roridus TaxID=1738132 RepID=A0AAD7FRT6_9AGAR|nr:hypothetical protein FB45DRAFT_905437 [Roridomyces roridus]